MKLPLAQHGRELRQGRVCGPDAVDVDLTREAAEETSDRLLEAALEARGHRKLENMSHKPK